jgi:hypothetical protein
MPKAILKSNEEIALLLATRPMRTGQPLNAVQARVLARLEIAIWIADALR